MVRVFALTRRIVETFVSCTALFFVAGSGDAPGPQNRLKSLSPDQLGLPAQRVRSCQTMDVHLSWLLKKSFRFTAAGQNLLQPQHNEFAGDNGNPAGIRRTAYAGLTGNH
jgi:hypothetical protein